MSDKDRFSIVRGNPQIQSEIDLWRSGIQGLRQMMIDFACGGLECCDEVEYSMVSASNGDWDDVIGRCQIHGADVMRVERVHAETGLSYRCRSRKKEE